MKHLVISLIIPNRRVTEMGRTSTVAQRPEADTQIPLQYQPPLSVFSKLSPQFLLLIYLK